jgi:hypothetical protein
MDALGLKFDAALVGIDMARILDPSILEVQRAVQNSRVILSALGAIPFLERLSSYVAGADQPSRASDAPAEPVPASGSEVAAS